MPIFCEFINKKHNGSKIELTSILEGNHPSYQTNKLRIRLIKEGIKSHECECCGVTKWLDNPISLELDHIDGNRNNHKLSNLRILCPNCHSQTSTYRGKNVGWCSSGGIGRHDGLKLHWAVMFVRVQVPPRVLIER